MGGRLCPPMQTALVLQKFAANPSVIFFGNTTSPYRAGRGKRRLWYGQPLFAFN